MEERKMKISTVAVETITIIWTKFAKKRERARIFFYLNRCIETTEWIVLDIALESHNTSSQIEETRPYALII